ncbi:MAG: CBS domain-containing protein [Gammaproteobacteria bacterium]|nr:CBS domain-containing protein [Gammaproteobacteria bacterium]
MFFYVQGPNNHDLMPLEKIFDRRFVNKTEAIDPSRTIAPKQRHKFSDKHKLSLTANYAYKAVDKLPENGPELFARQVMTTPVVTLTSKMSVEQTLTIFQTTHLRHLPVISSNGKVTGIVSDRDILRYMAGLYGNYLKNPASHKVNDKVEQLMQSPVLTASQQTDVRYIARLFIERRVGAMPIVTDGKLKGIITRSDILHAVMSHYEIELWI